MLAISIGVTKPLGLQIWDVAPPAENKLIFNDLCRVSLLIPIVP